MTEAQVDELQYSEEYAEYILDNFDPSERIICSGDTLLEAQESLYLFADFLMYRAKKTLALI